MVDCQLLVVSGQLCAAAKCNVTTNDLLSQLTTDDCPRTTDNWPLTTGNYSNEHPKRHPPQCCCCQGVGHSLYGWCAAFVPGPYDRHAERLSHVYAGGDRAAGQGNDE